MKLSDHFIRKEFACQCGCGFAAADIELLIVLEETRKVFMDNSVIILSGCRCEKHNAAIGGAPESFHCKAMAADFRIKYVPSADVYDHLIRKFVFKYGIGLYPGRVHLDIRPDIARWEVNKDDRQSF